MASRNNTYLNINSQSIKQNSNTQISKLSDDNSSVSEVSVDTLQKLFNPMNATLNSSTSFDGFTLETNSVNPYDTNQNYSLSRKEEKLKNQIEKITDNSDRNNTTDIQATSRVENTNQLIDDQGYLRGWDPRLERIDAFTPQSNEDESKGIYIIPFSSDTASSAFYDMVFTTDSITMKELNNTTGKNKSNSIKVTDSNAQKSTKQNKNESTSNSQVVQKGSTASSGAQQEQDYENRASTDRVTKSGDPQVAAFKSDSRFYGTASLMNPYSVTRLIGAFDGNNFNISKGSSSDLKNSDTFYFSNPTANRFYDIRDQRRFYDVNVADSEGTLQPGSDDLLAITNPTTTNIIKWSNKDLWGRTPYSFQDFVFCKYWNIIPNNRLITLRKYAAPTTDNLNFEGMTDGMQSSNDINSKSNESATYNKRLLRGFSPISTMVTYFGDDTGNKLSDIIKFSTGVPWEKITSDVYNVTGAEGSNPDQVADKTIGSGGASGILNQFGSLNFTKGAMDAIFHGMQGLNSLGKFVGLLNKGGYGTEEETGNKLFSNAMVNPYENGPLSNKIIGPVNKIDEVQKRKAGLNFSQEFNIKFSYIARPIGGINTKAAMLDILANCMTMGSANAMFWGGGHRFEVSPRAYEWGNSNANKGLLKSLYAGKIFGKNGAIDSGLAGIKKLGSKTDNSGNESFSFGNLASNIGEGIMAGLGSLGGLLSNAVASLFGTDASEWLNSVTGKLSDKVTNATGMDKSRIAEKKKNLEMNVNSMWRNKVIQNTVYPNVQGMKQILLGLPTGNWHLTIGNPLNPIAVIGNLISDKMDVNFGDELGPDDFPLEMNISIQLKHGMPRDRSAIESMFNRGAGKIYILPDYINSTSDQETRVDKVTGGTDFVMPHFVKASTFGAITGRKTYSLSKPHETALQNSGTTIIPKFMPVNPNAEEGTLLGSYTFFNSQSYSRGEKPFYKANTLARKEAHR